MQVTLKLRVVAPIAKKLSEQVYEPIFEHVFKCVFVVFWDLKDILQFDGIILFWKG